MIKLAQLTIDEVVCSLENNTHEQTLFKDLRKRFNLCLKMESKNNRNIRKIKDYETANNIVVSDFLKEKSKNQVIEELLNSDIERLNM